MSADDAADGAGGVKSARRVLDVLELLASRRDGLTFPEIAELLHLPKSSLHALLSTLATRGWLSLDDHSRRYRVGVRAWQAGQGYLRGVNLARIADRHMRSARDELDETVQLAILDGIENVYIAKVDANHPLRLVSEVGMRLPAYATGLGKVLLAGLPLDELDARFANAAIQRFTDRTIASIPELKQRLDVIRANGYGEDDGEYTEGVFCVAAPILDHNGDVAAAISCSVPKARLMAREIDVVRLREVLLRHAAALSSELGWHSSLRFNGVKEGYAGELRPA